MEEDKRRLAVAGFRDPYGRPVCIDGAMGHSAHLMRSTREALAEHGETAHGFRLGGLVLKNVPMLGQFTVFESYRYRPRSMTWGDRGPKSAHGR